MCTKNPELELMMWEAIHARTLNICKPLHGTASSWGAVHDDSAPWQLDQATRSVRRVLLLCRAVRVYGRCVHGGAVRSGGRPPAGAASLPGALSWRRALGKCLPEEVTLRPFSAL